MRWLVGNKSNLQNIVQVKENRFELNLSQKDYTPEDKESTDNVQYIQVVVDRMPSTFDIQQELIKVQKEYDSSDEVNSFTINGVEGWLNKQTRLGIINDINILEEQRESKYTLWIGQTPIEMKLNNIRDFINKIEVYAMACYANTQSKINEINNIKVQKDLFTYDITTGYPSKIGRAHV